MRIWIDADGCPREVKTIVVRASGRLGVPVALVANSQLPPSPSGLVSAVCVPGGMDAVDDYIVQEVSPDDIVITADIPLAGRVVEKGAVAIDPRGRLYDENTVGERLSERNFLQALRSSGLVLGGPAAFAPADKHRFAATLDRLLTKRLGNTS